VGQESLTVGSWRPPNSEVHSLALHGQAVRSILIYELRLLSRATGQIRKKFGRF